jgi:hypothetical protein
MAGFSSFGESGYQLSPPMLGGSQGPGGYLGLSIIRPRRGYASYMDPSQYSYNPGADDSEQHKANVYMQQQGLGQMGGQFDPTMPNYGFTPEDWNNVNRYISNPQNAQNTQNYLGITNRVSQNVNSNPQMASWLQPQKDQFSRDFPQRLGSAYNTLPPPPLQQLPIAYPNLPGMRY